MNTRIRIEILTYLLSAGAVLLVVGGGVAALGLVVWLVFFGGLVDMVTIIFTGAQKALVHDWTMAEVVLVLLLVWLVIRKR